MHFISEYLIYICSYLLNQGEVRLFVRHPLTIACMQWRIYNFKNGGMFAGHYCSQKGGEKPSFPIFLLCEKKNFGQIWPRGKYATAYMSGS